MKLQKCHILLLLDNCPSHPDIKLSNIKLVFLPKNTTSHLQPLNKGIIAWLKNFYKKQLMTEIRHAMDDCNSVIELAKKVTIYDAIVNIKNGWDQLLATTIKKCFKTCGIFDNIFDQPANAIYDLTQDQMEPDEFHHWFVELLGVPWEEYLACDDKLEQEEPSQAPTAMPMPLESENNQDNDQQEILDNKPNLTIDKALDHLNEMWKLFVDDDVLFTQVNVLHNAVTANKILNEIIRKNSSMGPVLI